MRRTISLFFYKICLSRFPYWECPAEQRLWLPIVHLYCLVLIILFLIVYH